MGRPVLKVILQGVQQEQQEPREQHPPNWVMVVEQVALHLHHLHLHRSKFLFEKDLREEAES
jgi:hypothetical protein